jgi:hypothetical protein
VNLLGGNIDTIHKTIETLIDVNEDIGLEVNIKKTRYMLVSHHQNSGENHDVTRANRSVQSQRFKYFGTAVTNQNMIQQENKKRLNFGNVCYHLVQNLFCSYLLSKAIRIRT